MAHSKTVPAASPAARAHFDWYTFLRSALINGFQAYGASLMVIAPASPVEDQDTGSDAAITGPSPRVVEYQPLPALNTLPFAPLAKPAWRNA